MLNARKVWYLYFNLWMPQAKTVLSVLYSTRFLLTELKNSASRFRQPKRQAMIFYGDSGRRFRQEDVLIGKVHELWKKQPRPDRLQGIDIIEQRYEQIRDYEKYLYNTGTRVIKIFLNVSKDEQARRFISRIDERRKNWKISSGDIKERNYWDSYMEAFETMVNKTSTKHNPWYVVPADKKWYARLTVSMIVLKTLEEIDPQWPTVDEADFDTVQGFRRELEESLRGKPLKADKPLPEFANPGIIAAQIVESEERSKILAKKNKD